MRQSPPANAPYHGWLYDADGIPRGIPENAAAFSLGETDRAALALKPYRLETCGRYVFVCMADDPPPLRDFLGRVYDDLDYFLRRLPGPYQPDLGRTGVNWKVGFENAAEGYHVRVIHKDSLGLTLGDDLGIDFIADHSV